jgi:purine-nucleoside phosphorylase
MSEMLKQLQETAAWLDERVPEKPAIALVLGSGLGPLAGALTDRTEFPYQDIPNFPVTTVPGHAGTLIFGRLGQVPVVAMKGRFHHYEGHDMNTVVFPIRVFRQMGVRRLFLTNAAGGVNTGFVPGDLMALTDHIGLWADSPLRGPNEDTLGPRFPDMSRVYNPALVDLAAGIAAQNGFELRRGVYAYCRGPAFETPAEIRALRVLGADAVGMSTVPEAVAARHMGMQVMAISCITNMAAGILDQPLSHEEVMETGKLVETRFSALVADVATAWVTRVE